jgi:hypothetical protein
VNTVGAVPFKPLEGVCVGAIVVTLADMSTSGVSVGTLIGPNADVTEWMAGFSIGVEWVL